MKAATLDLEYWGDTLLIMGWNGEVYRADQIPQSVWDELSDPTIAKITHTDADHLHLARHKGFKVQGPHIETRALAWLIDENQEDLSLEALVKKYVGVDPDKRLKYRGQMVYFTMDDGTEIALDLFVRNLETGYWPDQMGPDGDDIAWQQFLDYCRRDIKYTHKLAYTLVNLLKRHNLYDYWVENEVPFNSVIVDMELNGLPIDLEAATELVEKYKAEAAEREAALLKDLGYEVNIGSWQQLMSVLYTDVWNQPVEYEMTEDQRAQLKKPYWVQKEYEAHQALGDKVTKKAINEDRAAFEAWKLNCVTTWFPGVDIQRIGTTKVAGTVTRKGLGLKQPRKRKNAETDAATASPILRKNFYDHPWILDLLAWRKVNKAASYITSYFDFTKDGRLYGRFNRAGTVTGRISSSEPNMMNIPARGPMGKAIRGLFRGPGLIVGDHSQLEVRLLASFSEDPRLLDIYRNDRDIYIEVGSRIFGRRIEKGEVERDVVSKNLVLGDQYGGGPETIHTQLITFAHTMLDEAAFTKVREAYTVDRVAELQDELHSYFHVAEEWKQSVVDDARDRGYIMTIGGRPRRIDQSQNRSWRNDFFTREDRQAVNSKIQGSAADILQRNMLDISSKMSSLLRMLCQIHDELVMQLLREDCLSEGTKTGVLMTLKAICENPGWQFNVPLKFDPAFVESWADKA